MPTLAYAAPSTVEDAVRILAGASGVAKVLSGGTDLWFSSAPAASSRT